MSQLNESQAWAEIDRALGLTEASSPGAHSRTPDASEGGKNHALFREAGFSDEDARRGVRMLESGLYFDFVDAATSLMCGGVMSGTRIASPMIEAKVAEIGRRLAANSRPLEERRTSTAVRSRIIESATASAAGEAKLSVCLIDVGEGSSGLYPAATLQEAAKSKVFHDGLHCYNDHPTTTETYERPVRSVKDLAGCLEGDATYRDNGLWATVRVFSSHRDFITERASTIGMSIRADGEVGEATTPGGKATITKLTKAHSVDFVTQAGRGGRIESWT